MLEGAGIEPCAGLFFCVQFTRRTRENYRNTQAAFHSIDTRNRSAVRLKNCFDKAQANTRTACDARTADKTIENAGEEFRRDGKAGVFDVEREIFLPCAQFDTYPAACTVVFYGIVEQIKQRLPQARAVAAQRGGVVTDEFDSNAMRCRENTRIFHGGPHHFIE